MIGTLLMMWAGGLLGWICHPGLWLGIRGPFRWLHYLTATAAQESGYDPDIVGDVKTGLPSYGVLQFRISTWEPLTGRPVTDAQNPFWAGFYAAKYVQQALFTDVKWWTIGIPIYGFGVMRRMWRGGIGQSSADHVFEWDQTGATSFAGSNAWPAYWRWLLFFGPLSLGLCMALASSKLIKSKKLEKAVEG